MDTNAQYSDTAYPAALLGILFPHREPMTPLYFMDGIQNESSYFAIVHGDIMEIRFLIASLIT